MSESPVQVFVSAIDKLDLGAALSLLGPDARLMTPFGETATGLEEARVLLSTFLGELRETRHEITAEWNPEPGTWIAELTGSYELTDFSRRGPYGRAIILRAADGLIEQLTIYGAHELPLPDGERAYTNVRGPHGWLPTL
jgi:hypothetical protein